MLHILSELNNFAIEATDGKVGKVKDFYFDDRHWVIKYLVVEIESALGNHKILLSSAVIKHLNYGEKSVVIDMSLSDLNDSPRIDASLSVSPLNEIDYLSYYGYAFYWDNNLQNSPSHSDEAVVGSSDSVSVESIENNEDIFVAIDSVRRMYGDRHLRSCCEIVGYHIQANDGEIGSLQSMLVDDDTWAIQCCVTKTSNLWFGHQVLIKPPAIKDISWGNAKIYVDMTQQQVKEAPLFDLSPVQNPRYELGVYLHQEQNNSGKAEASAQQIN
jgi:sporulation protein YlmC with PRC-barrel domain